MPIIFRTFLLLSLLTCVTALVHGQKFYVDGSMVLSEVSADPKYGYEADHNTAIKLGSIQNELPYFEALRSPDGEPVLFERKGSCCFFHVGFLNKGNGLLDRYEVTYPGSAQTFTIYLNPYEYDEPKAPAGFSFVTSREVEVPVVYRADSIVAVERCNKSWIYSVEDAFLSGSAQRPKPDTSPVYDGGMEALQAYFNERPLTDRRARNRRFHVAIAFIVNCEGKAGRFALVSRELGVTLTLANQVLALANKMPQRWKPAIRKGKKVDAYQVMHLNVRDGQIEEVIYK